MVLKSGVDSLANLFNKLVGIIMGYAPIGICALMACTVGTYGAQLGGFLAKYLGASYVCVDSNSSIWRFNYSFWKV